ncbi:MAG: VOC family protein [Rhodospirillales bacterium]|nr:VOC family protein [Rhodospirillales bacterium]
MPLDRLDHISVNPADLNKSIAFYTDVLGLEDGPRPPFSFPGAWIYCGGQPVVHLIGGRAGEPGIGTGSIDHFAFHGTDMPAFTQRLRDHNIAFDERDLPGRGIRQVFMEDPDGVTIEVNFTG